ncbi:cyclic nucleotide-binding domain-containing protein [Aquisediminimonas profunda]|uniref:cyclic nucleotide-binding domain-containing protein n=1 Tax=Aquisediminimonas profunda TaxID=1550733 RepID=UPI001C62E022|nr:cyclic nucleotide-binding domain-containing protein [Aquisediminimonas profunda]
MREGERPEIAKLPLFAEMDEDKRNRIFTASFLQAFPPQLTLFEVGQHADFLHVLVDGLVELYTTNAERDTTMAIIEPVHSFILAAVITDQPYLMAARTLSASRVLLIPAELLRAVIQHDVALMQETMRELAMGYRGLVRALTDLKLRQSTERLGNFLLLESRKLGGARRLRLRGEKRLFASLLGMTPENLSRAFSALGKHGVIVEGANIVIDNPVALEAFARPDPVDDSSLDQS